MESHAEVQCSQNSEFCLSLWKLLLACILHGKPRVESWVVAQWSTFVSFGLDQMCLDVFCGIWPSLFIGSP